MLSSDATSGLRIRPDPAPISQPYTYELRVIQQPLRARMCGFGEKDRRPCTPPPILQLFIYDRVTGQQLSVEHTDTSFFTATCNLYSADMESEMDLIRQRASHDSGHGSSTGIVSAASLIHQQHQISSYQPGFDFHQSEMVPPNAMANDMPVHSMSTHISAEPSVYHYSLSQTHTTSSPTSVMGSTSMAFPSGTGSTAADTVRNLIGSSIATGAKLQNTDGSLGIFFVFPDLSIRKDGEYRLRFSFFDLKSEAGDIMRSSTNIKARAFSDPFRVYSAKQFPGMIESTSLSKHFAKQGVKIPVRKESGKSSNSVEDDADRSD